MLFIDGRSRFKPGKNQNTMDEADVNAITSSYVTGEDADGEGGVAVSLVSRADIESKSYDLNIGRYIRTETKAEADVDAALAALREAQERMDVARTAIDLRLREAGFDA